MFSTALSDFSCLCICRLLFINEITTGSSTSDKKDLTELKWTDLAVLGVPIIIVACRSDLILVDDAVTLKRAKSIQGQLRAIGLLVGAAVVYTSAVADINPGVLRKYIINKLYPETSASETELNIEVNAFSDSILNV